MKPTIQELVGGLASKIMWGNSKRRQDKLK